MKSDDKTSKLLIQVFWKVTQYEMSYFFTSYTHANTSVEVGEHLCLGTISNYPLCGSDCNMVHLEIQLARQELHSI